jgi:Toprim domain-containing protein
MIDVRAAARLLGGDVIGRDAVAAPGPGHSPRDRSLTVKFAARAPDGFLAYSHCGDDWRDCRDHVRTRLGLPAWQPGDGQDRRVAPSQVKEFDRAAIDAEGERCERTADDVLRIKRACALWDAGVDPRGTLAEAYLRSRAIALDDGIANAVLRFSPATPWRHEDSGSIAYVPALIAPFTSLDDGAVTGIQRIVLTPEGRKLGRRMLGVVYRAAVKLDPVGDTLAIGEGVETCLAARILGHAPTWALGSVGMIAQFPLVDGVACLRILGENDAASARASKLCGNRWHAAGRKVQVVMPGTGSDLNDELMAATP